MGMDLKESEVEIKSIDEPQVTSSVPEERILARRLRIQKRKAASKKREQAEEAGEDVSSEEEETVLDSQVESSTVEILTLIQEGKELISNVRVAADAQEVGRRQEHAAARDARLKKLEEEACVAQEMFEVIQSKWNSLSLLNDPLDLYKDTENQRVKCIYLLDQKDQLISELKAELSDADARYLKDQQRQVEDIALLVERIDSQIVVMRRAYRRELLLIEQAIDIERKQTMEINKKKWETLYKHREGDEVRNLVQRVDALANHNQLMKSIMVHHQEKFRATRISLEKDIQLLQQQQEQVKSLCLLNKEKMEYNYQVLKKRDEESLMIRSQQKRRINKLQDIVTSLRQQIVSMEKNTQGDIKRLASEVMKLHGNIKDIRLKADHFCKVNEKKYFQLWKYNCESTRKLLDKIRTIDRMLVEQQLGLAWQPSNYGIVSKMDLPSYRAAVTTCDSMTDGNDNVSGETTDVKLAEERLRCILEAVADRSGFLVEERLNILLAPYTRSQNTLVRIDNVFHALGVSKEEDMEMLRRYMEPHLVCVTCQPILGDVHPRSLPSSPQPILRQEEIEKRVTSKIQQLIDEGKKIDNLKKEKEQLLVTSDLQSGALLSDWSTVSSSIYGTTQSQVHGAFPSLITLGSHIAATPPGHDVTLSPPSSADKSVLLSSDSTNKVCQEPSHKLVIHPVFVIEALHQFVKELHNKNKRCLQGDKTEDKQSVSRQLTDSDVRTFWRQFRSAFPPEKEKLWDCLHLGLQHYLKVLQERHKTNADIEQLRLQNAELRRLLQKYTLPNNMKPTKGARKQLPPLAAKVTQPVSGPTPARLVLTFDNSSK